MTELNKALAQIRTIRNQVARGSEFRGYGPRTLAATAILRAAGATWNISPYWSRCCSTPAPR